MILIKRETFIKAPIRAGYWRWIERKSGPDETEDVIKVACPLCGCLADLDLTQHTVEADGTVTPSLVCPDDTCGWHDHVQLEGYSAP